MFSNVVQNLGQAQVSGTNPPNSLPPHPLDQNFQETPFEDVASQISSYRGKYPNRNKKRFDNIPLDHQDMEAQAAEIMAKVNANKEKTASEYS